MTVQTGASEQSESAFEKLAGRERYSLVGELAQFLRHNKKWWLTPILLVLLLAALFAALSGTALAPFLYPLW
jgi:hypothetical protein